MLNFGKEMVVDNLVTKIKKLISNLFGGKKKKVEEVEGFKKAYGK